MRKNGTPDDDYEDMLIKAIDESLAKYQKTPKELSESDYVDGAVERAECSIKAWMNMEPMHQGIALGQVQRWWPDQYVAYMDHFKYDSSVRTRFYRMGSPVQNRRALEWLLKGLRADLL